MSRHEFHNLSPASRVIVDQATRKDAWERAACDDLHSLAASEPFCADTILERVYYWIGEGNDPDAGPPPMDGLMFCLDTLIDAAPEGADTTPLSTLALTYAQVSDAAFKLFEVDEYEGRIVALMHDDRFALERLKFRVFAALAQSPEAELSDLFHDVLKAACSGLPRLCSPGR